MESHNRDSLLWGFFIVLCLLFHMGVSCSLDMTTELIFLLDGHLSCFQSWTITFIAFITQCQCGQTPGWTIFSTFIMLIFNSQTTVPSPVLLNALLYFPRVFFLLSSDYWNLKLCKVQLRCRSDRKEWWTWTWESPRLFTRKLFLVAATCLPGQWHPSNRLQRDQGNILKAIVCPTQSIVLHSGKIGGDFLPEHHNTHGETSDQSYCYWSSVCWRHVTASGLEAEDEEPQGELREVVIQGCRSWYLMKNKEKWFKKVEIV